MSDPATPSRAQRNRPRNGRSGQGRSAPPLDAMLSATHDRTGPSSQQPGDDEIELMALLGIAPPTSIPSSSTTVAASAPEPRAIEAQPGVLAVSKEDRQRSAAIEDESDVAGKARGSPRPGQKKAGPRQPRQNQLAQGEESGAGSASEGDVAQGSRTRRKKKGKETPVKDGSATGHVNLGMPGSDAVDLPGIKSIHARNSGLNDMSGLSQSLPADGVFAGGGLQKGKGQNKRQNGKGQAADALGSEWDMPAEVGPSTNHGLTWQQQLASYPHLESTPGKRSGKGAVAKKGFAAVGHDATAHTPSQSGKKKQTSQLSAAMHSPLPQRPERSSVPQPRPQQARRRSLDAIPPHLKSSQIETTPFHTGFNVHRAPQTPMRLNGNANKSQTPKMQLPIMSGKYAKITHFSEGFQRLLDSDQPFYAAPSIHNSPHQRDLPKPDISDF